MDFEDNGVPGEFKEHQPINESPSPQEKIVYVEKPAKRSKWRVFWRIIFVLSILANGFLFLALIGLSALSFTGQNGFYVEEVIRDGDGMNKIAIIRLEGIITGETSRDICKQIKAAAKDPHISALIIRTNTPGGGVAASDQINHEISNYRRTTNKPVVAFMQSVAASGGYYTSVACNSIVAEPTVITGSIGVIMQHFVLKGLMEDKLGVNPLTIKSGEKKGWPTTFEPATEEQITYLQEKVIKPSYNRFVERVAKGRAGVIDGWRVRELADGSIYSANEALDNKLIDRIGYIEDAIISAESLAGISNAKVVEYNKPFSIFQMLGAQGKFGINIDRDVVDKIASPRLQYLWKPF